MAKFPLDVEVTAMHARWAIEEHDGTCSSRDAVEIAIAGAIGGVKPKPGAVQIFRNVIEVKLVDGRGLQFRTPAGVSERRAKMHQTHIFEPFSFTLEAPVVGAFEVI